MLKLATLAISYMTKFNLQVQAIQNNWPLNKYECATDRCKSI